MGVVPHWKEGDPYENDAYLSLAATSKMSEAFHQSCSISMKPTLICLFIDINIGMYAPLIKSVDDATFQLILRHLFILLYTVENLLIITEEKQEEILLRPITKPHAILTFIQLFEDTLNH